MPFYATRPSDEQARRVLAASRGVPTGVPSELRGATGDDARLEAARARGFAVDRVDVAIGAGADVFERARARLDAWGQYPPSFTDVIHDGAPPRDGDVIVARIRTLGFWSLNPCLIVAATSGPRERAFAIQTLAGHAECGEERFWLRWDDDDRVRYGITALSRPHATLARLGAPVVRAYQRRFQRESVQAMEA